MIYYIKYFFFIAWNWGLRLAAFTIYHEIKGEKKYGIDTTRTQDVKNITVKGNNLEHAEMYQGASYYLLEKVFEFCEDNDINGPLIDFGCGKGRAMIVAAAYGFKDITGVDFALTLCKEARENINRVMKNYPGVTFNIRHEDVVDYSINDKCEVFFFFNPFNEVVMKSVLKNIMASLMNSPRKARIIYINPLHKELFTNAGFREIFHHRRLQYLEASILEIPVKL